jgi:hypothetical protein
VREPMKIGYDRTTGEFHRGGILYFDVDVEDDEIEYSFDRLTCSYTDERERAFDNLLEAGFIDGNGDKVNDDMIGLRLEDRALKEVRELFGFERINNEGHDNFGTLICKVSMRDYAQVAHVQDVIERNTVGGDDVIGINTPYVRVSCFALCPDENLANGSWWGVAVCKTEGSIQDWLDENEPMIQGDV